MNIWLVSYQEEVGSTSHEHHMLLSGQDFTLAELRFLDECRVSGSLDAPFICDGSDCRWEDYRP